MTMRSYTAKDWRKRAELARSQAKQMANLEAKRFMAEMAEAYDRLAVAAATRVLRLVSG
jgi:hypothetical protein